MSDCRYCGRPAGFLKSRHAQCQSQHEKGISQVRDVALRSLTSDDSFEGLRPALLELGRSSYIHADKISESLIWAWREAVKHALEDGLLTEEEELRLITSKKILALPDADLNKDLALTRLVQAAVLRDVVNGVVPQRIKIDGSLPFNFLKNEKLIWIFQGAQLSKDVSRKHFEGRSQGVSIRIVKGVYYRAGAFKGYPVVTTTHQHIDTGMLGITNKHIYFSGSSKQFRVAHNKIVSVIPYSDGVGIQKDGVRDSLMTFKLGDGWFAHNLLSNMNQLA